jgi:hypothetical protein
MAGYRITSDKGKQIASSMRAGDTYKASDGSIWKKNKNGTVSVTTAQGGYTANAYSGSSGSAPVKYGSGTTPTSTYYDPDTGNVKHISETPDWLGGGRAADTQAYETEAPAWLTNAPDMANRSIGSTGAITASDYYTKALEEQQRAIQQRIDAAVQANNAYIPQINQQSKQALQNAYIANQQARMRAPQALNALGMTGGASESSLLGLDTNYQNARTQIEQERSRALEGIRQNEAQIRATGDATLSEAAASYYDKLVAAALEAERQAQDQANWEAEFALQQKQYEDAAAQQAWQNAYEERLLALKLADAGKSSGSTYGGVTEEQIEKVSAPSGIRQTIGAVAVGLSPKNYTYRDVYNSIVPNRTPEGVRAAAQRLLAQGANPSYVEEALRALGYQ